jgi:hypothetical protein
MEKYKIPDYNGTQEFLCELAKRMGKLKKGTAHGACASDFLHTAFA